jgi:prepilin-type N-terminal cleavage/methylation domain-containing protein
MRSSRHQDAFALIELIVVILIFALLAGALVPRVSDRLASARDSRRVSDLRVIRDALEQYHLDKGDYPPATVSAKGNGWDVSTDNSFIPSLLKSGYLREPLSDPLNDAQHFYAYNVFPEGTNGCKGKGNFYVLGIKKFETPAFVAKQAGHFKCSRKDWATDFDHVTGGGASEKEPNAGPAAGVK